MTKMVLKFGFAGAIIYWLISKGNLDFSLLLKCLDHKLYWFFGIFIILVQVITTAIRWRLLLQVRSSEKLPILKIIKLTWIGMFFSSVLPGAVTGDLIKLVYAVDLDKNFNKTFLVTSVFIDRVIGLLGLLILLGTSSAVYYHELTSISPVVKHLVHINFIVFACALMGISTFFIPQTNQKFFLELSLKVPLLGAKIKKTLEQFWLIGGNKKAISAALAISVCTQTLAIFAFWIMIHPFLSIPMSFQTALSFVPLGLITTAIPISPAGLGVGHAAFATLFKFYGETNGASLFNIFFISTVSINLLGFIPYILSGKKHSLDETKSFEAVS